MATARDLMQAHGVRWLDQTPIGNVAFKSAVGMPGWTLACGRLRVGPAGVAETRLPWADLASTPVAYAESANTGQPRIVSTVKLPGESRTALFVTGPMPDEEIYWAALLQPM